MSTVVCISGPTGTGKSAAAIALARRVGGVIINADSRQVYRDFPIITAQPSADDQALCPHLAYGFLPTEAPCTAGLWIDVAQRALQQVLAQGKIPIFTGGTGMYMRSLFDGIANIPPVPPETVAALEARFDAEGAALHSELCAVDPAYAARIHPNDRQRITRALSVWQTTGKTFSAWHRETLPPVSYPVLRYAVGLPLTELEPRLARRIDLMLDMGALDEARAARALCDDSKAPGWSGIGCSELYRHLTGELSLEEAKALWVKNTRAYAKRQLTWFRADRRIAWYRPESAGQLVDDAVQALRGAIGR